MTEPNIPPAGPGDPYDTAPPAAPPPPPDAAMFNPLPPPLLPPGQPVGYAGPMTHSGYPRAYVGPPPDPNAKTMGMLCHLLSLAGLVIPLGNLIGPLVIWQMKKQEHPFIDDQGKESMNFQITYTIALLISLALICAVIGIFLAPAVGIAGIVLSIIATVKASNGEAYRYPLTIRFIK